MIDHDEQSCNNPYHIHPDNPFTHGDRSVSLRILRRLLTIRLCHLNIRLTYIYIHTYAPLIFRVYHISKKVQFYFVHTITHFRS